EQRDTVLRVPVILPPESSGEWLDPGTPRDRLTALLRPHPADATTVTEVGPAVNSPRNDGPGCPGAAGSPAAGRSLVRRAAGPFRRLPGTPRAAPRRPAC